MSESEHMREEVMDVIRNVRKLRFLMVRGFDKMLAASGLNLPQFGALSVIEQQGEVTMGQLTQEMGTTMGASTNIIDRLFYAGMVERNRDEVDRRIIKVTVTDAGREIVDRFHVYGVEQLSRFFVDVPEDQRKIFFDLFGRMVSHIERELARELDQG